MSLDELARRSGVSRAALSKIERGERNTSLVNALKIADALGAPLTELVGQEPGPFTVVRRGDAPVIVDPDSGVRRESLVEPVPGTELVRYELPPGAKPDPFPAHEHGTREAFIVLDGVVRIATGDFTADLEAGDAATVPGDQEHRIANPSAAPSTVLLMILRPR